MDNIVYGKTEGIKKRVLEQLQSLYDLHLDQGQLISEELALLLRDISESIGREVSVYVDRKGIISSVSVGSDHAVSPSGYGKPAFSVAFVRNHCNPYSSVRHISLKWGRYFHT